MIEGYRQQIAKTKIGRCCGEKGKSKNAEVELEVNLLRAPIYQYEDGSKGFAKRALSIRLWDVCIEI